MSRYFLFTVGLVVCWSCLSVAAKSQGQEVDVWIGTSGARPSQGIYHCTLDTNKGRLSDSQLAAEMRGPGFLALHPKLPIMYAVGGLNGQDVVAALKIDHSQASPQLKLINALEIGNGGAAHVSLDSTGRTLLTAQYGGGSVAAFSVNANGSLNEPRRLSSTKAAQKPSVPGRTPHTPTGLASRQIIALPSYRILDWTKWSSTKSM